MLGLPQLARAQLAKRNDAEDFAGRFVNYFISYAAAHSAETVADYDALEAERENILAVAIMAFERGDYLFVPEIQGYVDNFLTVRGYWDDATRLSELALDAARHGRSQDAVSRCAVNLGAIRQRTNRTKCGQAHIEFANPFEPLTRGIRRKKVS
jgi:hypothetical protein